MNYRHLTTENLQAMHTEALASLAMTGSETLYRTRLAVLGAVSAELASRK